MYNNKGFTLIESLFVLFIISISCFLCMSFHVPTYQDEIYIHQISEFLHYTQIKAMQTKQSTTLMFRKKYIKAISSNESKTYYLPRNIWFEKYDIHFNAYGHIKGAKTMTMHSLQNEYYFVYQVGSGMFYVR